MQKYTICEGDETFHISKNGNWEYSYNNTKIVYFKEQDRYLFTIEGSITTSNPFDTMNRVKEKVSKLMNFVK